MSNNPSLSEWLMQAQRGVTEGVSQFGPDFLKKANAYFTVDTSTNIFTSTYGRKVWHALNNQTRFFNAVPRVVWGNTAGWRVRTDRGASRSRPVTETGQLPDVDVSNIEVVSSLPRIIATTFGASVKSIFTTQLEGGIGDVLAMENENAQIDHVKELNQELLSGSAYLVSDGAATSFTVPASIARNFHIGDAVAMNDAGSFARTSGSVISGVDTATGIVTVASSTAFADGDAAFICSRAGFTSIDDITAEDAMAVGGVTNGVEVRAYDLTY